MSNPSFCKLVLIGDSSTGKTSCINQWVNRRFVQDFKPTVGTDFMAKPVSIGDEVVTISVWDTAGQERFRSLSRTYYKGSEVVVVVFDLTDAETFDHVEEWVSEFKDTCHIDANEKFPVFVVGNKSDLDQERAVAKGDALRFCQARGWNYHETSAKLADGIDALFRECATAAVARRKQKTYLDEFSSSGNDNKGGNNSGPGGVQRAKLVPVGRTASGSQIDDGSKKKLCSSCGSE